MRRNPRRDVPLTTAQQDLVLRYWDVTMGLARRWARQIRRQRASRIPELERTLQDVAGLALIAAAQKFEPDRVQASAFGTFAAHCVRGALKTWHRDLRSSCRMPHRWPVHEDFVDCVACPHDWTNLENRLDAEAIQERCLPRLSPGARQVIQWLFFEEVPPREAMRRLQCGKVTLYGRRQQGIAELRALLVR